MVVGPSGLRGTQGGTILGFVVLRVVPQDGGGTI